MTRKQDDITRRRRLNNGRCPTHGTALAQIGIHDHGPVVACPREDCSFQMNWVEKGGQ